MLSYADIPLLIPTRAVDSWIESHLSLDDLFHVAPPHEYDPKLKYPRQPRPRFNSLYWPTGAQRWATFYCLVDTATKDKIDEKVKSDRAFGVFSDLKLGGTVDSPTVTANMYLLPPRPVASIGEFATIRFPLRHLWILPFVDQRYWWQFIDTDDLDVTDSTTWATLYSDLGTALGVTITADTVHSDYLRPDPKSTGRKYANIPALLDAVAHSVGQRIVVDFDGTVTAWDWETSEEKHVDTNIVDLADGPAGADFSDQTRHIPAQVHVSFPKACNNVPLINGDRHEYVVNPSDTGATWITDDDYEPNWNRRIHSVAYADFTTGGASPDNNTRLDSMADRIAEDYYNGLKYQYDYKVNDIQKWIPTGYDDSIIYTWARLRDESEGSGAYECSTRIQSSPHNFGIEEMLQSDHNLTIYDTSYKKGKADAKIVIGSCGTVSIWENGVDTTKNVSACLDWHHNNEQVSGGKEVSIWYFYDQSTCGQWVIIGAECESS